MRIDGFTELLVHVGAQGVLVMDPTLYPINFKGRGPGIPFDHNPQNPRSCPTNINNCPARPVRGVVLSVQGRISPWYSQAPDLLDVLGASGSSMQV